MDKTDINNFIVSMRSCIEQARVHICNKFAKEKRRLLNDKVPEEKRKKNSQKLERLLKEILIIKRLENDDITKYVLLCDENPEERFHKCVLGPDERVKMRFAIHKSVSKRVEEFRAKFPEWELKLPPIIVQLGMLYQTHKKPKRTSKKKKNNKKDKDNEKSQLANKGNQKHLSEPVKIERVAKIEDGKLNEKKVMSKDNVAIQRNPNETKSSGRVAEVRRFADLVELENKKKNNLDHQLENKNNNSGVKNLCPETKTKGLIAEVQRLKDNEKMESNNITHSEDDSDESSSTDNISSHVSSDPFFLAGSESEVSEDEGGNGREKHYEKPDLVTDKNEHFKHNDRNKCTTNKYDSTRTYGRDMQINPDTMPLLNRKQRRLLEKYKAEKGVSVLKSDEIAKICQTFASTKCKSFPLKVKPQQRIREECAEEESLHPSWEAKRKQKNNAPFQGKKIKFDDD